MYSYVYVRMCARTHTYAYIHTYISHTYACMNAACFHLKTFSAIENKKSSFQFSSLCLISALLQAYFHCILLCAKLPSFRDRLLDSFFTLLFHLSLSTSFQQREKVLLILALSHSHFL